MRKRITIQLLTKVRDDFGQVLDTWTDEAEVWGSLEPLTGREQFAAQQVKASITHRVRMRALPSVKVTPRDRLTIKAENRTFNIQSVANVKEQGFELEIIAEEYLDG
jgi:SPP1 family predicted phage head-tail adaptor